MLIPVRVIVKTFSTYPREVAEVHTFYKDTELPIAIVHMDKRHAVRLKIGDISHDFALHKEQLPLCLEGIARIVIYLDMIYDVGGILFERLSQHWSFAEDVSSASDFVKTPELPKIKKPRAKRVKVVS